MKEIALTQGQVALVDDEDHEELSRFKWHAAAKMVKGEKAFYAARTIIESTLVDGKTFSRKIVIYMHRLILGAIGSLKGDHRNGNTLDNRRENLRECTKAQNNMNARKPSHGLSSPYKGVVLFKRDGRFRAYIKKDGKQRHLGYFDTQEGAAMAYNQAAKELFGEFALLNQVEA